MVDLTFDYYDKKTTDILLTPSISMIGGLGSTTINAGRVSNKGWEFSVNLAKSLGDWELSLFGGISKNKNKITKLVSGPYDNGSTIHQEGHPLNSFYMYKTDGLLQESDFTTDADGDRRNL